MPNGPIIGNIPAINVDGGSDISEKALKYARKSCAYSKEDKCQKHIRLIISGRIKKKSNVHENRTDLEIIAKISDTESNPIKFKTYKDEPYVIDAYVEGSGRRSVRALAKFLANKISVEFPLLVGRIINRSQKEIITTNLSHPKLRQHYGVIAYEGDEGTPTKEGRTRNITNGMWEAEIKSVTEDDDTVITE